MEKYAVEIKALIVGVFGFLTALWGWFGWLAVAWVALMVIDYITGSVAARMHNEWTSDEAKRGRLGKLGSFVVVLVTGVVDIVLGLVVNNIPGVPLPFEYTVLLSAVAIVWYAVTDVGSIFENVMKMGVPMPGWLQRIVKGMKVAVDLFGNKMAGGADEEG